jgi:hypothetical protein
LGLRGRRGRGKREIEGDRGGLRGIEVEVEVGGWRWAEAVIGEATNVDIYTF